MMKASKKRILGGKRAAAKNKANEPGFYVRIGTMGGKVGGGKGGFKDRSLAKRAGKLGHKKAKHV